MGREQNDRRNLNLKVRILNGSPKRDGNTSELLKLFRRRLLELGAETDDIFPDDLTVNPCRGCCACRDVQDANGCMQEDDAEKIWMRAAKADVLVLATPIYTWYCTLHMKALPDRHYALNKFYRSATGQLTPHLYVALVTTHGHTDSYANEPFETGIQRLCTHTHWDYLGLYSARDVDGVTDKQAEKAIADAMHFAEFITDYVSRETWR